MYWSNYRPNSNSCQSYCHLSNGIYETQKSPETSQLWDHVKSRKQGYLFVTKLSLHIYAYIAICAETGIGTTCGSQWLTHETGHVKPLSNTHWSYIGLILSDPWNRLCKAIVLPQIDITCDLSWQAHETAPVRKAIFAIHSHHMGITLVYPWNCLC